MIQGEIMKHEWKDSRNKKKLRALREFVTLAAKKCPQRIISLHSEF